MQIQDLSHTSAQNRGTAKHSGEGTGQNIARTIKLAYNRNMNLQELQTKKVKSIFAENHVELAYVFGSQITGRSNVNSDIDIAVLLPKNMSKTARIKHRFRLISQLNKLLGKPVDLVLFNDLNSLFFKFIITKEGKNIFRKDEHQYLDFECQLMGEYYDFKPFLDLQNKLYVERSLQ